MPESPSRTTTTGSVPVTVSPVRRPRGPGWRGSGTGAPSSGRAGPRTTGRCGRSRASGSTGPTARGGVKTPTAPIAISPVRRVRTATKRGARGREVRATAA
ncbi:hypothetical protein KPB2_5526 [Klebsiella pneumoniae Kb677]|nr:hypothetical protein KPB2_5526 [Klebsiella pneumoniae Kb677]